jgi:CheY-like chemotaxis protein
MHTSFLRLTPEGRSIWSMRHQVQLPLEYRRILGLVDYSGHVSVIRSLLGRFPRAEVEASLRGFEELRLVEQAPCPQVGIAEIVRKVQAAPIEPEDNTFYEEVSKFADISLSRLGVYLPNERLFHRTPSSKAASQTLALVVEDDPDQCAIAALRLMAAGYRVATVATASELLRYLQSTTPEAIFLDINLPDGNGFDILAGLRRHPRFTHLPVIMLTARTKRADIARGLALTADAYVTKPYAANTLEYVLRCFVKREVQAASRNVPAVT